MKIVNTRRDIGAHVAGTLGQGATAGDYETAVAFLATHQGRPAWGADWEEWLASDALYDEMLLAITKAVL